MLVFFHMNLSTFMQEKISVEMNSYYKILFYILYLARFIIKIMKIKPLCQTKFDYVTYYFNYLAKAITAI